VKIVSLLALWQTNARLPYKNVFLSRQGRRYNRGMGEHPLPHPPIFFSLLLADDEASETERERERERVCIPYEAAGGFFFS
jgi:hypothetical protein